MSALQGAGQGAAAGSSFGPWGAVIGGALGAVSGALGGSKGMSNKEAFRKMEEQAYISRREIPLRIEAYKDAGIHPLYSISGTSFTPSMVAPQPGASRQRIADAVSSAGQNISRAAASYQTSEERAYVKASQTLSLENQALQNDLLRSQLTTVHSPSNPAFPSASSFYGVPGQGDSRSLTGFDNEGGADVSVSSSRNGNLAIVPSNSVKNRIEDMIIPEVQWYLRQLAAPKLPGYTYNPFTSETVPDNKSIIRKIIDNSIVSNKTWGRKNKSGPYIWNK